MEQTKVVRPEDVKWEPHPELANVSMTYLLSHRDEKAALTIAMVRITPGAEVAKHTHEADDIIYIVSGKGKMEIEGMDDVNLVPGTFLRVPRGVAHKPYDIEGDFIAYDVFYPYIA